MGLVFGDKSNPGSASLRAMGWRIRAREHHPELLLAEILFTRFLLPLKSWLWGSLWRAWVYCCQRFLFLCCKESERCGNTSARIKELRKDRPWCSSYIAVTKSGPLLFFRENHYTHAQQNTVINQISNLTKSMWALYLLGILWPYWIVQ